MTFESTPADFSSVNGDLVYVCYDAHAADPVTYPNYKYVGEIFINAVKVFTAKVFPNPDNNRGIFNFGSIIREYVEAQAPSTAVAAADNQENSLNNWKIGIVVKIREEYSGTLGAVVLTDSERFYYNHYNARFDDFTRLSAFENKLLSNRPLSVKARFADPYLFIPYFFSTGTDFTVSVTVGATTNVITITPTATKLLMLLNISPTAINVDYPAFISSSTSSYTVTVGGTTYTVSLVCDGFHTNYVVHFLNQYGGFESMLFNKVSRKTNDIERKSWQQLGYRVSDSGVVSLKTGDIMHAQKSNFGNRFTEKLRISTDLLTDAEYQWLAELVRSPFVLLEDNGTFYPVVITDNNYEFKEKIVDRFTNLSLNVEFGTTYKTQYR